MKIELVATCSSIDSVSWKQLMRGKRKTSYSKLCNLIKDNLPHIYEALCLELFNPYSAFTFKTNTHFILTHSAIEYFFKIY
ncbi:Uncharacterised protein [Helicobacter fennelliae]|uniref:Uncharacterized protein n=1 Tax=Helicobacter fennelliae TaxID=215 RepID=A0A2X3EIH7_9HELI|nr:Uncharacterised protein [Helicobacter fennelliae]